MSQDDDSIVSKSEPAFRWPGRNTRRPASRSSAADADELATAPAVEEGPPLGPHPVALLAGWAWRGLGRLARRSGSLWTLLRRVAPVSRLLGGLLILAGLIHLWQPLAASAHRVEMLDRLAGLTGLVPGGRAITLDIGPALASAPGWWWICAFAAALLHFAAARSAAAGRWRDAALVLGCGLVAAVWAWFTYGGEVLRPPILAAAAREALIIMVAIEALAVLAIWLFTRAEPEPDTSNSD